MASFRLFNIQLLPLDTAKTPEVGVEGYQRLFATLKENIESAQRLKTLADQSYKLPHDTHFAPFVVHADKGFAHGKWVKYQRAEAVVDLYTNESLYTAGEGVAAVSNNHYFQFVFDYVTHRFAIEELQGKLPSSASVVKALDSTLRPVADQAFPEHVLTVNLISEKKALEEALAEATGFRSVEVKVTFPNGPELSARLRELKENNVHVVRAQASSEKDAVMPSLPDFILDLVKASTNYGQSKFTYVRDKLRRGKFSTEAFPQKVAVRHAKDEDEAGFLRRLVHKVRATQRATESDASPNAPQGQRPGG